MQHYTRRVILDTGILVSAAIRPDSIPALALEKALLDFDVCTSQETLAELESVLGRSRFDRYAPKAQREAFIAGFREQVAMIDVSIIVTDCPDPKDNMFLALAETAIAELIISSDPHLTSMHPWRGIPILPPAAFLVGIK